MQKNDKYTQARTLTAITENPSSNEVDLQNNQPLPTIILKLKKTLQNGKCEKHEFQIENKDTVKFATPKENKTNLTETDNKLYEIFQEFNLTSVFNKDIILFGGIDPRSPQSNDGQGKSVLIYNSQENKWDHLSSMPGSRHHHSAVTCNGRIYVIGGTRPGYHRQKPNITQTVWSFDPYLLQWCNERSLPHPRRDFGIIASENGFYVIGGEEDAEKFPVSTTLFYDVHTKYWHQKASLNIPRSGLMVTLISNNKFWAAGGIIQKEGDYILTDSIEEYNMDLDIWNEVGILSKPSCYGKICCVNKSGLYLVGGVGYENAGKKFASLTTIEKYIPESKNWLKVGEMSVPRHGHDVIDVHDKIVIFGGVSTFSKRAYRSIECYSTRTNKLIEGFVALPNPTSGLSAILMDTVRKLSQTNDSNQSRGLI